MPPFPATFRFMAMCAHSCINETHIKWSLPVVIYTVIISIKIVLSDEKFNHEKICTKNIYAGILVPVDLAKR